MVSNVNAGAKIVIVVIFDTKTKVFVTKFIFNNLENRKNKFMTCTKFYVLHLHLFIRVQDFTEENPIMILIGNDEIFF